LCLCAFRLERPSPKWPMLCRVGRCSLTHSLSVGEESYTFVQHLVDCVAIDSWYVMNGMVCRKSIPGGYWRRAIRTCNGAYSASERSGGRDAHWQSVWTQPENTRCVIVATFLSVSNARSNMQNFAKFTLDTGTFLIPLLSLLKVRIERRNWTEMNWQVTRAQWASRASPLVIGWRVRERSHVGYRRCLL